MNQLGRAQKRCTQPLTTPWPPRTEGPDGKLSPRTAEPCRSLSRGPRNDRLCTWQQRLLCVETSPPFPHKPKLACCSEETCKRRSPGADRGTTTEQCSVPTSNELFCCVEISLLSPVACGKNKVQSSFFLFFFKKAFFLQKKFSYGIFHFCLPSSSKDPHDP